MLPFSVRSFRRLRREAEAPRDELDIARTSVGALTALISHAAAAMQAGSVIQIARRRPAGVWRAERTR